VKDNYGIDCRLHLAFVLTAAVNACSGSDVTVTRGEEESPAADDAPAADPTFVEHNRRICPRLGHAPLSRASGIDRYPYLQSVTAHSAVIALTLHEAGAGPRLTFIDPPNGRAWEVETLVDPADATGLQRIARLASLQPDTIYCYQLDGWAQPVSFRTPPRTGEGRSVRFAAFGDSGGGSRDLVRERLEAVPVDLLLHTGDIAYQSGTLAEFEERFFDTYAELLTRVPIFPASGNHDNIDDAGATYRQVFVLPQNGAPSGVERWYSFDWGDVHFVALDTERVGTEQTAWLERDLARNSLPWRVAYLHRPPYSSGTHGSSQSVREAFAPLFERFGVQLVLAGHDHDYERTVPLGGVTYVVTGGGGYSTRAVGRSDFTAYAASVFHFVLAEVRDDELFLRAIDTAGATFDEVWLTRGTSTGAP
jgi:acid phosphatase type 7